MQHYCPECDKKNKSDYDRYGFILHDGYYYWTKIPEIRTCCAVKVQLITHDALTVTLSVNNKEYIKNRNDFMKSSWRDIDSY